MTSVLYIFEFLPLNLTLVQLCILHPLQLVINHYFYCSFNVCGQFGNIQLQLQLSNCKYGSLL